MDGEIIEAKELLGSEIASEFERRETLTGTERKQSDEFILRGYDTLLKEAKNVSDAAAENRKLDLEEEKLGNEYAIAMARIESEERIAMARIESDKIQAALSAPKWYDKALPWASIGVSLLTFGVGTAVKNKSFKRGLAFEETGSYRSAYSKEALKAISNLTK